MTVYMPNLNIQNNLLKPFEMRLKARVGEWIHAIYKHTKLI